MKTLPPKFVDPTGSLPAAVCLNIDDDDWMICFYRRIPSITNQGSHGSKNRGVYHIFSDNKNLWRR